MIDLKHKYALLEDGSIEPLYTTWGELREVHKDEDGDWYLDQDLLFYMNGLNICAYRHDRILATGNNMEDLEVLFDGT